jgi:glyoxylase I family protein
LRLGERNALFSGEVINYYLLKGEQMMKLEHIAINVTDPAAMAKWYAEHLDMEIVRSQAESPHMHFIADKARQSMLELYHNPAAAVPDYAAIPPINLHFAFAVDDMEGARDRLVAAGATAEGEIATTPAGDQLLFLRDPWQVTIQLVKRSQPML